MVDLKRSTIITFWALVGVFLVIISQFFVPAVGDLLMGSELFLIPMALFCLLGIVLLVLVVREKVGGKLKKFLLLTGVSATGFFIFVVLHNVFYALGVVTENIFVLNYLMQGLHVIFFLMATPVCLIGFLVGLVGSIVLLIKKRKRQ